MFNYDRLLQLIAESGESKAWVCRKIDRPPYYLRDVVKQQNRIPEETQRALAKLLNTTVEYLNGESDVPHPMDVTLERILSLIPKNENGKYVHGAKKTFCESIGAPTNIISEWEAGKTKSYRNYLYQISDKYNVSVEWLMGESDVKEKSPAPEMSAELNELVKLFDAAPEELRKAALAVLRSAEKGE